MNFSRAFQLMKQGKKVKLPNWGGYWAWEKGSIMMHTKEGNVIDIRDTKRPEYTFGNVASNDFIIANKSNTPILNGMVFIPEKKSFVSKSL
mgnify:FL=1